MTSRGARYRVPPAWGNSSRGVTEPCSYGLFTNMMETDIMLDGFR